MIRVLEVNWCGGCNNGAVKRGPAMPLAEPGSHAFAHRARVWLDELGRPQGAWWDDGRMEGDDAQVPARPDAGRWVRFRTPRLPAALWALAQTQGHEIERHLAAA